MNSKQLVLVCSALLFFAGSGFQAVAGVIYVNDDAPPPGDGLTWATAYVDLQDALTLAQASDEIWVASGLYTPSDTDATASFFLIPGVAMYGGFTGNETSQNERDWVANETVLSGDIGRDDVITSWPNGWDITTSNAGHVVVASGTDRETVLDGFTIADGHTGPPGTPAGHELMFGSGIFMTDGSPTIRNCKFTHNLAAFASGGGLYCLDGNPFIDNCTFVQNYVHGGGGGGIFVYGNSIPEISRCDILNNISVAISVSNVDGDGAGVGIYSTNWVTISGCRFDGNRARPFFSIGDELGYGGGLWVWNGGVTVNACEFTNNTANYGAGVISWGPAVVVNSLFRSNTAIPQPNDPYPEQGGNGAGITAYSAAPEAVDVINCTIAYNNGKKYVGAVAIGNAQLNIYNSIVRENSGTHPETIGTWKEQIAGFNELAYSNVSHIFEPHGPGEDPLDPEDLPGVIDADPLFVGPLAFDLHLEPGSPCIDAGDNSLVPPDTVIDLDGNERFVDEPDVPDTGAGTPPIVDIGAYEFQVDALDGDFDGDGDVDLWDFGGFVQCETGPFNGPIGAGCETLDFDDDDDVDRADFVQFQLVFTGP